MAFEVWVSGRSGWAGALAATAMLVVLALATGSSEAQEAENRIAELDRLEARLITASRQLTFEGRRAGEGYFSADGTQMVFQSEREPGNPFYQIYLMDLETGDVERVSPGHGKTTCAWIHPDNERVLFASTQDNPEALAEQKQEIEFRESGQERRYAWDYDEHFEIYERDGNGKYTNLTNARGYDAEGSYSPDGSLIAFSSNRHAYTEPMSDKDAQIFEMDKSYMLDLYIMNSDGSNLRRLTNVKGYDGGPFFSPDGKKVCWRRFSENGATAEIYSMNIDGTDERRLTEIGAMSWAPYFHPSGEYLIFTTNKHGFANFELYLVAADGRGEPVRVTYTEGFDGLPVFTPDGKRLAWTSTRQTGRQGQIFVGLWNHEEALRLIRESKERDAAAMTLAAEVAAMAGDTKPAIDVEDCKMHVAKLADEVMAGRQTGTRGERLATEYVAHYFERMGLAPAGDDGTYFQSFPFTSGVSLGKSNVMVATGGPFAERRMLPVDESWRPLAFSEVGSVGTTGVVFAGYGIVAPEAEGFAAYDSYSGLDVTGKWVVAFRFLPEDISPERRQTLTRYASLRYKAMIARDRGAAGLILVSGPRSTVNSELIPLAGDGSMAGTSVPVVSITNALGEELVAPSGKTLEALQGALDGGAAIPGFELNEVAVGAHIELEHEKASGRNVLARLRAEGEGARRPAIVIGAHVDHLGHGAGGNSLAGHDEEDGIHYGADDNASGVAAILEVAEYLVDLKKRGKLALERDILFAAWSGEEMGLLGSKYYVDRLRKELGQPEHLRSAVAACLNLDMVGRMEEKLVLNGVASSKVWTREIERRNAPIGLPLALSNEAYLPTDATSFYLAGVPILSFFTGAHTDYHTPRDTPEKLNYEELARISRFTALLARSVATNPIAPDYVELEKPDTDASRAGLRVYLGTIPDYVEAEIPGLRLQGVGKGGPAYKAGLKSGDIIVELAGRKVENIHDYTFALDSLKVGETVTVVVVRGRERLTLEITPGSRE